MVLVGDDVRSLANCREDEVRDSSRRLLQVRGSKREQFRRVLTLDFSPKERGTLSIALNEITIQRLFQRSRAVHPLPFRKGEGRGEGLLRLHNWG